MKKNIKFLFTFLFTLMILSFSCSDDSKDNNSDENEESTYSVIKSDETNIVSSETGYSMQVLIGTVPENQSGDIGQVAFSIETGVEPPVALPGEVTQAGSIIKYSPDGFIFNRPIRLMLPIEENSDLSTHFIAYFNAVNNSWEFLPLTYYDTGKKEVGTDVIELGYFALVKYDPGRLGKKAGTKSNGGVKIGSMTDNEWWTLTVASVQFKYSDQSIWWSDIVGRTAHSGSDPTGVSPYNPLHMSLPQGEYQIWISKSVGSVYSGLTTYTYSVPASVNVDNPLDWTNYWGTGEPDGYHTLELPGGGEWVEGWPTNWPTPTVSYGNGDFQATLTWVNTDSDAADLDLHLYGPDSMHVCYYDEVSSDSSFQLDRDWQDESGNATENIFSLKSLPKGKYTVRVNYYSGTNTKSFNVRIINGNSVKSYRSSLPASGTNYWYDVTEFTIN